MIKKTLRITGAAILILSLMAVVLAFSLPDDITREQTVVSYQQDGGFSYQTFLKPSTLYGGAPAAAFPAEVIKSFDFTFTFKPASSGGIASGSVTMVLSNPGIWQKRVSLAAAQSAGGTSPLNMPFSIDQDAVEQMFTDIETELKIESQNRALSVEALVTAGTETFTHRLDMEMTDTLVRVGNNLKQGQLAGETSFAYTVALKPNSVFDTATLSPPAGSGATTAPAGEPVLFRLADEMVFNYRYDFTADQSVSGVTTDIEVVAVLSAPELWAKEYPLFKGQRGANFNLRLALDLAAFNDLIETVRTETGVSADSYKLDIKAVTRLKGSSAAGPIDETFEHIMKGTISRNVLTWDKELTAKAEGAITQEETVPNDQKYLGLSLGNMRTWSLAFAILGGAVLFSGFMIRGGHAETVAETAEKELAAIHKKYGARIVSAGGILQPKDEDASVITLNTMEGLISVADELGKPVVYFAAAGGADHTFCVIDGKTRYQYTLSQPVPAAAG